MLALAQGPQWFANVSIGIELLSFLVLAFVAFKALRFFQIAKDTKWLVFGFGFALLATAFLGNAILTFALGMKQFSLTAGGVLTVGIYASVWSSFLFFLATVISHFIFLFGIYLVYYAYLLHSRVTLAFIAYALFALMYFSSAAYFIFHLTALILFLVVATKYLATYWERKLSSTRNTFLTFTLLCVSQFLFVLVVVSPLFFVAAQLLQLVGFILLLFTLTTIRHGKKIASTNH